MPAPPELDAGTLRWIVPRFPEHLPITDEFEAGDRAERARKPVSYRSQREHIEWWLAAYDTPGYYSRQRPGGGAKNFYNRFKCAGGLIWLAEAVGVSEEMIRLGVEAVRSAPRNPAAECGAFRRDLPWSLVERVIHARAGGQPCVLRRLAGVVRHDL